MDANKILWAAGQPWFRGYDEDTGAVFVADWDESINSYRTITFGTWESLQDWLDGKQKIDVKRELAGVNRN